MTRTYSFFRSEIYFQKYNFDRVVSYRDEMYIFLLNDFCDVNLFYNIPLDFRGCSDWKVG